MPLCPHYPLGSRRERERESVKRSPGFISTNKYLSHTFYARKTGRGKVLFYASNRPDAINQNLKSRQEQKTGAKSVEKDV